MNQNICLCYNIEKGIYTKNCHSCSEAIFITYDTKGYKTTTIEVPTGKVIIHIESNFKFGRRSYLYAKIECDGKQELDFTKDKIRVLNHSSVSKFSIPSEDWEELFKKIVDVCNSQTSNVCPTSAISYVDELCKLLNNDSLEIKGAFHDNTSVKWDGKFLTTLLVGDKLRDLIDGLCEAKIEDEVLTEHIQSLCRQFLRNLKTIEIDLADKRTIRIAETLNYVCEFMMAHGGELDFLKFFHDIDSKN